MSQVITLIAAANSDALDPALVEDLAARLVTTTQSPVRQDWLAPGEAVDISVAQIAPEALTPLLESCLQDRPIDYAVQASESRRKSLLVADMESTIIGQEMLDELAEMTGIGPEIIKITARAMRGELDFDSALKERVARLSGLSESVLEQSMDRITLNPGAVTLIQTMRGHGAYTALVSGGFNYYTSRIRVAVGFDMDQANQLDIRDGELTGEVIPPILGRQAKRDTLLKLCKERGLKSSQAAAVGDGANDLAMLKEAGLGVAYHAKPLVREDARFHLDHVGLEGLLYLQGYHKHEFVTGTEAARYGQNPEQHSFGTPKSS